MQFVKLKKGVNKFKMEIYTMDGFRYDTYLQHHGTKGQKWGRRRYQNLDGSLTPLGKLRYGIESKAAGGMAVAKYRVKNLQKQISEGKKPSLKTSKAVEKRIRKAAEAKVDKKNKQKYEEELAKYKEDLKGQKSLKGVMENKDIFSNEELDAIYTRKMSEKRVSDIQKQEHGKAYDFIEKASSVAGSLSKAYNAYDTIHNVAKKTLGKSILPDTFEQKKEQREKEEKEKRSKELRQMGEDEINANLSELSTEDLKELSQRAGYIDKINRRVDTNQPASNATNNDDDN